MKVNGVQNNNLKYILEHKRKKKCIEVWKGCVKYPFKESSYNIFKFKPSQSTT